MSFMENEKLIDEKVHYNVHETSIYSEQPANYSSKIPWVVQQQIAATNGIHYKNSTGKMQEYPIPSLPFEKEESPALMLDIGCGWGRWLVNAGQKGFIPIGVDIRMSFCKTSRIVMKDKDIRGYVVVADLRSLPFKKGIFDKVWSFSVIQHCHKDRLLKCIYHIHRILKKNGTATLEFPNRIGIRNRFGPVIREARKEENYNSWAVRYYTPDQYRDFFKTIFGNFRYSVHSMLGIGILKSDLKYVTGLKNKITVASSLLLTSISSIIPFLRKFADSIYVQVEKSENEIDQNAIDLFIKLHSADSQNNMNILPLLACPLSQEGLVMSEDGKELLAYKSQLAYPIIDQIPILIPSEARKIN